MKETNKIYNDNSFAGNAETHSIIDKIQVSPEVDEMAEKMKEEIRDLVNRKIDRRKRRLMIINTVSIAASILLILGIFITYIYTSNHYTPKDSFVKVEAGKNERIHFSLSDGTTVYLNSNSSLVYPSKFKKNREVTLTGEAYFEVTHDKERSFIVKAGELNVLVHGTRFNVQSFRKFKNIEVTLLEGKVGVTVDNSQDEMLLLPGRQAVYDKLKNQITERVVDVDLYTSWVNKNYVFDQKPFEEIATTLENRFNVKVIIASEKLKKMKFTGEFKAGEKLEDILNVFAFDKRIEYEINHNTVYIRETE